MKHITPFDTFLERKDSDFAEILSHDARKFFDTIKKRVVEFFYKYIDKCEDYDAETCSDYADILWSTSWDYLRISRPPVQVFIKANNRQIPAAAAAYITTSKRIEVYSSELKQLLTLFEKYAGDALTATTNKWEGRDMAAVYREKIEEFDYSKLIEFLQHELVHHFDYNTKAKTGYGSRADIMDRDMERRETKRMKVPQGMNADDYYNTHTYKNKIDSLYYNANHEYQAYFMSYASSVQHDIKNGKPLPETFHEFKAMSIKDYQQLRINKMDEKNRRAIIKRMYDLYSKLKTGEISETTI